MIAGTRWVYQTEDDYVLQRREIAFIDFHRAILKGYIGNKITGDEGNQDVECNYVYNFPNVTFTNNNGTETGKIFGNTLTFLGLEYTRIR